MSSLTVGRNPTVLSLAGGLLKAQIVLLDPWQVLSSLWYLNHTSCLGKCNREEAPPGNNQQSGAQTVR